MYCIKSGETIIGAFKIPQRKKPIIGIQEGGVLTVYGSFRDEYAANVVMKKLMEFIGIEPEGDADEE